MSKLLNFVKRNVKEILRDPIIYIFCLGFPLVMLILFTVIGKYSGGNTPMFDLKSLLPGIIMFSYTFVIRSYVSLLTYAASNGDPSTDFFTSYIVLFWFLIPSILEESEVIVLKPQQ